MSEYRSIRIERGSGGFGGPLTITPTATKNKIVYITGGGAKPAIVDKIAELTGAEPVNGFQTSVPENEIALAIIDCGGTLRCGIYPQKRIPTVNIMPTGKSGPLAKFITEDIYVSAVGLDQIQLAESGEVQAAAATEKIQKPEREFKYSTDKKISQTLAATKNKSIVTKFGLGAGKVINTFYQAGRDAVQTMINTIIPFMAFVSLLIGIIQGSGIGNVFAKVMSPLAGNIWGLL